MHAKVNVNANNATRQGLLRRLAAARKGHAAPAPRLQRCMTCRGADGTHERQRAWCKQAGVGPRAKLVGQIGELGKQLHTHPLLSFCHLIPNSRGETMTKLNSDGFSNHK